MVEKTWDDSAALSTAPIFDDAVYLSEALGLPVTQSEDDLDAELALLARESGIEPYHFLCPPPPHDNSRALSTITVDSDRSSIHSQETQSTGFTSAPSRTSKDHMHVKERSPARRLHPQLARASLLVENYGHGQNISPVPPGEPRRSASTLSVAQSVLSNSSSVQQPPRRKKRGSALFAMFRKDSSSCVSRAHHGHHNRSRGTKLECGHTLSIFDVRVHVQDALKSGAQAVPNCCGKSLPRSVLEDVLTREETDLVLNGGLLQSPDLGSAPDSGYSEGGMSSIDLPPPMRNNPLPSTLPEAQYAPARRTRHQEISVDLALANEAFKSFKAQQKEQFERVSTFECNQRKALSVHHQWSMKQLTAQHEASKKEKTEEHIYDLDRLEDKQLTAEHDLRQSQEQETKNVATALKFMERYCLGTNADEPENARTVTEEDFKKLDRQRLLQKNAPRKHENAINVLRAKQEREMKRKVEQQGAELAQMGMDHEKEIIAKEAAHKKELEKLDAIIEARRKRLLQRWDLKFEMWRRDWEEQHHTTLKNAKLEHEDWPSRKADHAIVIAASSSLAPYVKSTA